ncbi:diguanylate cyclase [Baekduia soli]|uniref:Diguanylate cyclase n=1 Tax=Baekduia soli TaxID=496014 RepID=A0A5B8U1R2_9ACTN|nr:diguanylate cyclase [Baekduia soli]QEC46917.1 diguanylate cyclase [Baekduia soli]
MSDRGPFGDLRDRLSSFRTRLRLFFLLIVIVPMVAVTLVVFKLIAESEQGQADARVAGRQEAAISLYYNARSRADRIAAQIGRDPGLASALRAGDDAAVQRAVVRLRASTRADRIVLERSGTVLAQAGDPGASFPARRTLVADGRTVADLEVSVQDAATYATLVRRVTRLETLVLRNDRIIASTIPAPGSPRLPPSGASGKVEVGGQEFQAASFAAPGFGSERVQVTVLEPHAQTASAIRRGRLKAGVVLAGFFLLALVSALVVSRSLNRQIEEFLAAARRLGAGDFSARAPTRGRDQFAQLGGEFNNMAAELDGRLRELAQERLRLELSLRRIGETFASSLDRDGLLEIVVRTAVDAVDAVGGHALAQREIDGDLVPVAGVGDGSLPAAVAEAEREVLATGQPSLAEVDGGHALAHPLRAGPAAGERADVVTGLISVWRPERAFTHRERELFHYLAGQAAVSVENVGLHETVERQAVTDELTGLSNRRRFQETMSAEVERSKRFGQELGLVMLDIDDFKAVNDSYGHQQGDLVLREVARILRASSREIDEPARYGGEELAVILPGTGLPGAYELAERVREGIEALRLPIVGDPGAEPLQITASFGAAALPTSADSVRGLVAAADEALYQAKRAGKNQTVRAP